MNERSPETIAATPDNPEILNINPVAEKNTESILKERCHTSNRNQQSQEQENHVAVVEEEVEDVLKDEDKAAELLNLI
ncbi:hypothetical protein QE152_g10840 [Popillia japonica]|uniref:Uncharacterized protein n=1 Tax=Popillia japonica TaxID=7064 RepID=A0AAW1LTX8_POPJA